MRDLTVTNAAKMNQERAAAPLNNTCSLNCDQEQVQEGKKELSGNLHQKLHASSAAPPDNDCKESELEKGKENKQEKQPSRTCQTTTLIVCWRSTKNRNVKSSKSWTTETELKAAEDRNTCKIRRGWVTGEHTTGMNVTQCAPGRLWLQCSRHQKVRFTVYHNETGKQN